MKRLEFVVDEMWGYFYIIPTIAIQHERTLNGYWSIELRWLKWVFGVNFGHV